MLPPKPEPLPGAGDCCCQNRPQDWLDVEGIIVKSGRMINWEEVRADLASLLELKGDTAALGRLDELRVRLSTP